MWKAAFTGRSDRSDRDKDRSSKIDDTASSSGHRRRHRSGSDDKSVVSTTSRRTDGDRKKRTSSRTEPSVVYGSAPISPSVRQDEPARGLTESAIYALNAGGDDEDWEDDDGRSVAKSSRRGDGEKLKRRKSSGRSEKERERDRDDKKREKDSKSSRRDDEDRKKGKSRAVDIVDAPTGSSRAIPPMGSFDQFPGMYDNSMVRPPQPQEQKMSGALPYDPHVSSQFPGQNPSSYAHSDFEPNPYGAAADFYNDKGDSVQHQPGIRASTPMMMKNPDMHLTTPSAAAQPAQDTGNGAAADYYGSTSAPSSSSKPSKPLRQDSGSSSTKQTKKPGSTSSATAAAATMAALGGAAAATSHHHSSPQNQASASSYYDKQTTSNGQYTTPTRPGMSTNGSSYTKQPTPTAQYSSSSSRPGASTTGPLKPIRHNSEPVATPSGGYYASPSAVTGQSGKHSPPQSNKHAGVYAAAGAAAAGMAAYEMKQHHDKRREDRYEERSEYISQSGAPPLPGPRPGSYYDGQSQYGTSQYGCRPGYAQSGAGSYYGAPPGGLPMGMHHRHEHKGPITRLKDGFLNLLSSEDDVRRMEEYTEYIGVCKYCFDPRSTPADGPRQHHYHPRKRDSFESLRRRSIERLRRRGSPDSLRQASRIEKESRYYASSRKNGSKTDLLAGGLAAAGVATAAGAMFNSNKNFDDTYSVKSGHRASSAVRRRSSSSSRERRRRSSHGVIGADEYVTVRRKDGKLERRRAHRSRSRSGDRRSTWTGAMSGAALGAGAASVASGRQRRDSSPERVFVRHGSHQQRSRSRSHSPGLGEIFGFAGVKSQKKEHRKKHKKTGSFFTFSNGSSSSSDGMAFGDLNASRSSLGRMPSNASRSSLGRVSSTKRKASRKSSDDKLNATMLGIGATAAALAAAQKHNRVGKRQSRPDLAARRDARAHDRRHQRHDEDDEWEDELPSDDASSDASGLAFGDEDARRRMSRQSFESVGSQSSAGGLSAWGWRWGGKNQKRRRSSANEDPSLYQPRHDVPHHDSSTVGPIAAGLAAGAALDAYGRPLANESAMTSQSNVPQAPMQFVDPQPVSEAGSRHASMPGAWDQSPVMSRPGPAPLQQPQPIAPFQPAFTQQSPEDPMRPTAGPSRPSPRRTMSSPTRDSDGNFIKDAALIGGAALATASIIASQSGRRSKEPGNVRFGFTEEQQKKYDRAIKDEQKKEEEERRRADRTRALKDEAERFAKEEDDRLARAKQERQSMERQTRDGREAKQQAESDEMRLLRESREREEAYERERKRIAEEAQRRFQEQQEAERQAQLAKERREREEANAVAAAKEEATRRIEREREIAAEVERKQQEILDREKAQRESKTSESGRSRKGSKSKASEAGTRGQDKKDKKDGKDKRSSSGWEGPVAAGAAGALAGAVLEGALHKSGRESAEKRDRQQDENPRDERADYDQYTRGGSEPYLAQTIEPSNEHSGAPITDDDLIDPDFFKRRRSASELKKHEELARKAAQKVISEREEYYNAPSKSQKEFFMPKELLDREPEGKERVASPLGDNDVQIYNAHYEPSFDAGPQKPMPFGRGNVPMLNVIAPTPPISVAGSVKGDRSVPQSPNVEAQDRDSKPRRPSAHGRGVSWGEDTTHMYEVKTPDSFNERDRDGYIREHEIPRAAQTPLDDEVVVEAATPGGHTKTERYGKGDLPTGTSDADGLDDILREAQQAGRDGFYKRPFYDSVSDFTRIDSPGTEGAPPVRGYIEGETDEPTPAEEKARHIPGGFDDDVYEETTGPAGSVYQAPEAPKQEAAWEPPLSKKDKKKKDKAAKRSGSGAFDIEPATPIVELEKEASREQPSVSAVQPQEEPADYFLSKKDKKKKDKAAKRAGALDSEPVTPAAPEPEPPLEPFPAAEPVPVPAEEEDAFPLSKKEKKKREKAAKKGFGFDESTPSTPANERSEPEATPADDPWATAEAPEPEAQAAWEPPLSKKEQKKREKEAKAKALADAALPVEETSAPVQEPEPEPVAEPEAAWEAPISKKEQKKRDKEAKQRALFDEQPASEEPATSFQEPTSAPEPKAAWEPPLSKKEQKKREKEAKKQGFADVAVDVMTGAGLAAVVDAASSKPAEEDEWGFSSGKKSKKGKKKLGEPLDDDPRDIEPPTNAAASETERKADEMPGGWHESSSDNNRASASEAGKDLPREDLPSPPQETSAADEWGFESKKSKKKKKRDSSRFNEPAASSPLRAEVAFDDYVGAPATNGHADSTNGVSADRDERAADYFDNNKRISESPRQVSPEDAARSVISAPADDRRRSKSDRRRETDYYDDEPYAFDDSRSVAASEPAFGESRSSKRRSKTYDDDAGSVISSSSRSRRDRDKEDSPTAKKEKKGGLFGLFSRKSSDGVPLSKTSARDSKGSRDEDDDERRERRHRRKRTGSEYGDDDDMKSVVSSSSRRHRDRDERDEDSRERHRHRSSRDDSSRHGSGSRHSSHRSRDVDDPDGPRHHRRHRSGDLEDSRDQSFLGERVEDLPPLPASRPASPISASARAAGEQGLGTPGSAEVGAVDRAVSGDAPSQQEHSETTDAQNENAFEGAEAPNLLHFNDRPAPPARPLSSTAVPLRFRPPPASPSAQKERSQSFGSPVEASPSTPTTGSGKKPPRPKSSEFREFRPLYLVSRNAKIEDVEEQLPSLPSSKPSSRASSVQGNEEWHSAAESMTDSPPQERRLFINTDDANKMFRTEEDILGSEQTTPKASEWPVTQGLGERPPVHGGEPRQQPQFYTWEDFQQDERMHDQEGAGEGAKLDDAIDFSRPPLSQAPTSETVETIQSGAERQVSPSRMSKKDKKKMKGLAAAAMLGGGAALAAKEFADHAKEKEEPAQAEEQAPAESASEKPTDGDQPINDVNALMEGTASDHEADSQFKAEDIWGEGELPDRPSAIEPPPEDFQERPSLSRKSSKKAGKKGKKGKGSEPATPAEPSDSAPAAPARSREPEVDFDDWFGPPTAGLKEESAPQTPPAAEVEAKPATPIEVPKELFARTPAKGSKKKAKKGRKSVGSISEPQSPALGVEDLLDAEGERLKADKEGESEAAGDKAAATLQATADADVPSTESKDQPNEPTAVAAEEPATKDFPQSDIDPTTAPAAAHDAVAEQEPEEPTETPMAASTQGSADDFAPTLTRKQSKKSKKKQKTQAAFNEPTVETPVDEGVMKQDTGSPNLPSEEPASNEPSVPPIPEAAADVTESVLAEDAAKDAHVADAPAEDDWTAFGSTKKGKKGKKNKKKQADPGVDAESEQPAEVKDTETAIPAATEKSIVEQAPALGQETSGPVEDKLVESAASKDVPASVVEAEEKGGLRSWLPWSWSSKKPTPEEVVSQPTVMTAEETTKEHLSAITSLANKETKPPVNVTKTERTVGLEDSAAATSLAKDIPRQGTPADDLPKDTGTSGTGEPHTDSLDTSEPAQVEPPQQQAAESVETPQTAIKETFDPWAATTAEQAPQPNPADVQIPTTAPVAAEQAHNEALAAEPQQSNVEADAPQPAAPQDDAEDFWAAPSKKKKGKKGKKSVAATPPVADEPIEQPLSEQPGDNLDFANELIEKALPSESREIPSETQDNEEDSFWTPEPTSKKGKKAKKAAAAAAAAAASATILSEHKEPATNDSTAMSLPTDADTTPVEAAESTPVAQGLPTTDEQQTAADEDFWTPQPSKKNKKKNKKPTAPDSLAPSDEIGGAVREAVEDTAPPSDKPEEIESFWTPKSSKKADQPSASWDDLVAEETPLPAEASYEVQSKRDMNREVAVESAPEPAIYNHEPAAAGEDEWSALPAKTKKKKKDKKGKKAAIDSPDESTQDLPAVAASEALLTNEPGTVATIPAERQDTSNDVPAQATDTAAAEPDDLWDTPSKAKKGKKGKKNRLSLMDEAPMPAASKLEPPSFDDLTSESRDVPATEQLEPAEDLAPVLDAPDTTVSAPVDAAADDEWALPAKVKKGKKGKKNWQSAFDDLPTPSEPEPEQPNETPTEVQQESAFGVATASEIPTTTAAASTDDPAASVEPQAEDEWALLAKGKKGKKNNKVKQLAEASEPLPTTQDLDAGKTSNEVAATESTPSLEPTPAADATVADITGLQNAPSAEPTDEGEGDWSGFGIAKKSKKDKKKTKKSPGTDWEEEVPAEPKGAKDPEPTAETLQDQGLAEPSHGDRDNDQAPGVTPAEVDGHSWDAISAKKNKKDKKKAKQAAAFDWDEPTHEPEITSRDQSQPPADGSPKTADDATSATAIGPEDAAQPKDLTDRANDTAAPAPDEWDAFSTKKSRKDKKKARKAEAADFEEQPPASQAPLDDDEQAKDTVRPLQEAAAADFTRDPAGGEEAPATEADDWAAMPSKKSKKDKKKAQKAATINTQSPAAEALLSTPTDALTPVAEEHTLAKSTPFDEPTNTTAAGSGASETDLLPSATAMPDVERDLSSAEEHKADSRTSNVDNLTVAADAAGEIARPTTTSEDQTNLALAQHTETGVKATTADAIADEPALEPTAPPAETGDDFEAFPSKKSKKDKKKAKKAQLSDAPIPEPEPEPEAPALEPVDTPKNEQETLEASARLPEPIQDNVPRSLHNDTTEATKETEQGPYLGTETVAGTDDFGAFSTKKSKKDKKKAKKSYTAEPSFDENEPLPTLDVPTSEPLADDGEPDSMQPGEAAAAGPGDEHWAETPAKKSKKEKRRGTKSEAAIPLDTTDELSGAQADGTVEQVEQIVPASDRAAEQSSQDPTVPADRATQHEDHVTTAGTTEDQNRAMPREEVMPPQTAPGHDIDFAATLAAGLADTGFDPNLVVDDPVFRRRTSPPGQVAEADPEEVFSTTNKKGKKSKSKQARQDESQPEPAGPESSRDAAGDDFDAALARSLHSSGFDAGLLQNMSSSQPALSANDVDGDGEISFAQPKGKKKKGKKRDTSEWLETTSSAPESVAVNDAPRSENIDATHGSIENTREAPILPEPAQAANIDTDAFEVQPVAEASAAAPEDEWSAPTKMKSKKGKKNRQTGALDLEDPVIEPEPTTITMPPPDIRNAQPSATVPEAELANGTSVQPESGDRQGPEKFLHEEKREVPTADEYVALPAPIGLFEPSSTQNEPWSATKPQETRELDNTQSVSEPAPSAVDNEWAESSKKKGKKNKKKAAAADIDLNPFLAPASEALDPTSTTDTAEASATEGADPASWHLLGGDGEMDPDEMDKAYKAYKKNKRKQKKQQAAAAAGTETGQGPSATQAPVDDNKQEFGQQRDRNLISKEPVQQPLSPVSPTNSASSKVQSLFPGLQRVKRRAPSVHDREAEGNSNVILHTSEVSQHLPATVEKSPRPSQDRNTFAEAKSQPDKPVNTSRTLGSSGDKKPPLAEEGLGLGVIGGAAAAAGLAATSKDSAEQAGQAREAAPRQPSPLLTSEQPSWSFDKLEKRDGEDHVSKEVPPIRPSASRDSLRERRSAEPLHIDTGSPSEWDLDMPKKRSSANDQVNPDKHARTPGYETPLEPTSRNRASYLFQSPPGNLGEATQGSAQPTSTSLGNQDGFFDSRSVDAAANNARTPLSPSANGPLSPRLDTIPEESGAHKRTMAASNIGAAERSVKALRRTDTPKAIRELSPRATRDGASQAARSVSTPLAAAAGGPAFSDENRPSKRVVSDTRSPSVLSNRSNVSLSQQKTPEDRRTVSRTSNRSSTPNLRRVSLSGDLRAASRASNRRGETGSAVGARSSPKTIPFEPPPTPPLNEDEFDAGASRGAAMSDVFQGFGGAQGSQASPTRPPSVRKRQSMHIMELENKLDMLVSENRALQDAKFAQPDLIHGSLQEQIDARDLQLRERDNEILQMRTMLEPMQQEISRLMEMNGGLTDANRNLVDDTNGRYATLQEEHAHAHQQWQSTSRELETLREDHGKLTAGMREAIAAQLTVALADKDHEIRTLREELEVATERIRALQVQIQGSKSNDFLTVRDEDYFDGACQKLCQHAQQWVLRFSKTSDNRICRLSSDLRDDKIEARLDNALLDGSDVDKLLGDRVRRRDVFMSVVMTMVWEYVFTRYLFGMDREQRQKLKALEKILSEVGPPRAVAQWRATTLTLLSKRPAFGKQCGLDTEAVAHEIFGVLCQLLPPPTSSESTLLTSLQKVVGIAVELSIEMRTQRAEYIMLPPLQPEYDTNGDLVRKVHFNASLMNERSGLFNSNEELEKERAIVKLVLFPLVVKKGDESGEGEEEIVVCPAQVLVHNNGGKDRKVVRVMSGAMEIDDPRKSRQSLISNMDASMRGGAF